MRNSTRSLAFDLSVFAVSIVVLGYFSWHAFYGPRSYDHLERVRGDVAKYQGLQKQAEELRDARNDQVALLRPQSIDPDMLDEMARKRLEFVKKNNWVVLNTGK
jgi:cell division protein FtsB